MTRIAILASGGGSGFESIADAVQAGKLAAQIEAVVCDQPHALVLEKARARGIAACLVPAPDPRDSSNMREALDKAKRRELHDQAILSALDALPNGRPEFLVLAGYMRVLSPGFIHAFRTKMNYNRIVNIHPSLLPAFPGRGGYAQAFRHGAKLAGATIHLVDDGLDSGPICAQASFSIADCQSAAEVESLGKALEHRLYPETLNWVLPGKFECVEILEVKPDPKPAWQRRFRVRPI